MQPGPARARWAGGGPALCLVLALAAAAALWGLGRQPLWYDEVATAYASGLSWHGLRALLGRTDANVGAYYALLHVLRALPRLPGHLPVLLRLPSALASVGTVLLTQRVGRRLLGPGVGLAAAALLAVHPFATAYARDARAYALVALCCTGALLLGLRAVDRPTTGRLAAYGVVSALSVCLHLYAVLPLAAYALALLPAGAAARRRWLLVQLALAPVVVTVLVLSLRQTGQLAWVPGLSAGHVLSALALLCGGALPLGLVLLALPVVAGSAVPAPARRVLLAGLLLPVAGLVLASLLSPTLVPRYLVATVPLQCLLLAAAGASLLRRRARLTAVLAVALVGWLGVTTAAQAAAPYRYEDYRAASRWLLAGVQAGDGVVYEQDGARLGVGYYLPRVDRSGRPLPVDVLAVAGAPAQGFSVPDRTGAAAAAALARFPRVWVVRHLDGAPRSVPGLARYACTTGSRFGAVAVQLCHRGAP